MGENNYAETRGRGSRTYEGKTLEGTFAYFLAEKLICPLSSSLALEFCGFNGTK